MFGKGLGWGLFLYRFGFVFWGSCLFRFRRLVLFSLVFFVDSVEVVLGVSFIFGF